jgi:hypothetical protein
MNLRIQIISRHAQRNGYKWVETPLPEVVVRSNAVEALQKNFETGALRSF